MEDRTECHVLTIQPDWTVPQATDREIKALS